MIRQSYAVFVALAIGFFSVNVSLFAQSDDLRIAVANMRQDISWLNQRVQTLYLEIETLQRENERLREKVATLSANNDVQAQINALTDSFESLRRDYREADEAQKKEVIAEVSRQIAALGRDMQTALDTMAKASSRTPSVVEAPPEVHFSDDYPKTGKPYVVRKGDTLSGIARDHGSTVKYIQNANKIVDPARDLRVGATIFIPIPE